MVVVVDKETGLPLTQGPSSPSPTHPPLAHSSAFEPPRSPLLNQHTKYSSFNHPPTLSKQTDNPSPYPLSKPGNATNETSAAAGGVGAAAAQEEEENEHGTSFLSLF